MNQTNYIPFNRHWQNPFNYDVVVSPDTTLKDIVKEVMHQEDHKKEKNMFYKKKSFREVLISFKGTKLWHLYHCKRNHRAYYEITYRYRFIKNTNKKLNNEIREYFFKPDRLIRYSSQYYDGDFNQCLHVLSDTFQ